MHLFDILKSKGSAVHTVLPDATLEEATRAMVQRNIGALLVCERDLTEGERVVGIITERDILRFSASGKGPLSEHRVSDIMTTHVVTGAPSDPVEETMGMMTKHRIRHMPVLSEGRLVGLVSIGDLVKNQIEQLAMENHFLKRYIVG